MKLYAQTPKQSLNKAFLKQPVNRNDITLFKANLQTLLGKIDEKESEEHHKNFIRDLLKDTFYKSDYEINTKGRQDLVIHVGKDAQEKVGVILEAKKPTNKGDMISADNPNRKALHELVLYFLRERIDENNSDVRNLVVTNINEWFIFDASAFNQLFFENKAFVKDYKQWRDKQKTTVKTDLFYNEIAKPFIDEIEREIPCTYFDIRKYETALNNADEKDDESLIELFKILSPQHLLKVPFADDSNKLDKNFYTELLHIIGLEETKDKGKLKIDRKVEERRDAGSLIENAITIIKTDDLLTNVINLESYGADRNERLFGVALELCLTWINRVLFLKLLEAQLVDYHKGNQEYRFLDVQTIKDFDGLYRLFHQVLAINVNERIPQVKEKFRRVPYLNSSLFEPTDLEKQTLRINALNDTEAISFNNSSILKDGKQNGLPTLEYLFKFLDAYDFASEGISGVKENNRSLINASVLGKIFEKVNNAKAGSIYTPGFITMYMCRQAIRLAIVQKFKDAYGWNIIEFADIKNYLADRRSKADILEFNALVNSLHLCDPAVGSGHFLVSSLNEIIAIKCELGILADADGGRFADVEITIENDELIVFDTAKSEFFKYQITDGKPNSREAQRLQKTLFHEKQTLIENCLFGVDIIPHSVKICRLRLWIELLKNAYYKESSGYVELETLPNIDINIKEGNSLVSRFALDEDLKEVLKNKKNIVEQYRTAVADYKRERNRDKKRELLKIIDEIKGDFQTEIYKHHPKMRDLLKAQRRFDELNSRHLFEKYNEAEKEIALRQVQNEIDKLNSEIEAIKSNVIYRNAFEWRFEFPEVLDNKGNFLGFDIVIGNPPYGAEISNRQILKDLFPLTSFGQIDTYKYFIELAFRLSVENGFITYITSDSYLEKKYFKDVRAIMNSKSVWLKNIKLGDDIFEDVNLPTAIFSLQTGIDEQTYFFRDISNVKGNDAKAERLNENESLEKISANIIDSFVTKTSIIKENNCVKLIDAFDQVMGVKVYQIGKGKPKQSKYEIENDVFISREKKGETYFPFISQGIERYNYKSKDKFINYGEWLAEPRKLKYFVNPKIVIREIVNPRIFATYIEEDAVVKNIAAVIVEKDRKFSLKYLLGLLNSNLFTYYLFEQTAKSSNKSYPSFTSEIIKNIPIKKIKEKDQQPFVALVDQILELKKAGKDTQALENEIDRLVYRLYDLTADEIKIVEGKEK